MEKLRDSSTGHKRHHFPEELIREILLRLPVKSLLRFRSVCKSWLSVISDPLFAKSHFELASNLTPRLMYLTPFQTRARDVKASFYDHSALARLNCPLAAPFQYIQILGSCRGFLLLDDHHNLFVWNPSTGSCKKLSYPPITPPSYPSNHGFGYDSLTDDYVIVVVVDNYDPNSDGFGSSHIEFLSLKNNNWQKFEETHLACLIDFDHGSSETFLNGAIHWLAFDPDAQVIDVIVAFDLAQKSIRQLPLPDFEHELDDYYFGLLGGCLSLSIVEKYNTEIWLMKEYGLKSSWEKCIVVPVGEIRTKYFIPKCFTKGNEIVGIYNCGEGLIKCNREGELLEYLKYVPDHYHHEEVMYTESLLALPSGIVGGEDGQS